MMRSLSTSTLLLFLHLFLADADRIHLSALRGARNLQNRTSGSRYRKRIPASSFVEKKGATLNDVTNSLPWLNEGDWVKYQVDLPVAGSYLLQASISCPFGDGAFQVVNQDSGEVYASFDEMPVTHSWEDYATIKIELILPKGSVSLTIKVVAEGWSLQWLALSEIDGDDAPSISNSSVPILDAPSSAAPPVNTTRNATRSVDLTNQPYRTMIAASTYSEMEGMLLQDSTEGLKNLYWIDRGDSVTYDLKLPVSGVYLFKARISSPDGTGAFQVRNMVSDDLYASVTELPSTGSFQTWETITTYVELPAGDLRMAIRAFSQGWNLLWIVLELQADSSPLINTTSPVVFINNGM